MEDDGLRGKYFTIMFNLEEQPTTSAQLLKDTQNLPQDLLTTSNGEYIGKQAKYYMDVPDNNGLGISEVVAYIADVYIKIRQKKEGSEQVYYSFYQHINSGNVVRPTL
jgi:hypothetical protein